MEPVGERTFKEPFGGCKGVAKSAKETLAVKVRSIAGHIINTQGETNARTNHAPNAI